MSKTIKRSLVTLVVLLGVFYIGLSWFFSNQVLFPTVFPISKAEIKGDWEKASDVPLEKTPVAEDFSITTKDKLQLNGWYFKNTDTVDCAVVLAHGWGSTRIGMLRYADIFWDCGCDIVAYDHRGHGSSGGKYGTGGVKEKDDLLLVTDWLQQKTGLKDKQIAWFGASWGGATALLAGATGKEVAFIGADSPFQNWHSAVFERAIKMYGSVINFFSPGVMTFVGWRAGVHTSEASPLKAAAKIKVPVFLIHSQTDEATSSQQSVNIAAKLNKEKSVFYHTSWEAEHAKDIVTRPTEYREKVYDFLRKQVGGFGIIKGE